MKSFSRQLIPMMFLFASSAQFSQADHPSFKMICSTDGVFVGEYALEKVVIKGPGQYSVFMYYSGGQLSTWNFREGSNCEITSLNGSSLKGNLSATNLKTPSSKVEENVLASRLVISMEEYQAFRVIYEVSGAQSELFLKSLSITLEALK